MRSDLNKIDRTLLKPCEDLFKEINVHVLMYSCLIVVKCLKTDTEKMKKKKLAYDYYYFNLQVFF